MTTTYETYQPDKYLYVLGVDIGIHHLALSLIAYTDKYDFHEIVWFELRDITEFAHLSRKSSEACTLHHTKTFTDWLEHVFYLHTELFQICSHILIERQPPQGFVVIEQLIFSKFRDRAVLIHPKSVHSFYGWKCDYEMRKVRAERIVRKYVKRTYLLDTFDAMQRKHDIADSVLLILFWLYRTKRSQIEQQQHIDDLYELDVYKFQMPLTINQK